MQVTFWVFIKLKLLVITAIEGLHFASLISLTEKEEDSIKYLISLQVPHLKHNLFFYQQSLLVLFKRNFL
jgi:hypothetical protein